MSGLRLISHSEKIIRVDILSVTTDKGAGPISYQRQKEPGSVKWTLCAHNVSGGYTQLDIDFSLAIELENLFQAEVVGKGVLA